MIAAGVSTDFVNLRNLDVNSLLRLCDRVKAQFDAERTLYERDHLRRALVRVQRELKRRGARA